MDIFFLKGQQPFSRFDSMTTVILRKARKSIMYSYILLFVTLQGCNVARFMSDDQQCTFDGEHGNIREHIDIDGYYYIGDKDNCEDETFRYILFFEDGSFSVFYWEEMGLNRNDPFKYTGMPDIDLRANIGRPFENSSVLCNKYELEGGAYRITGDSIICESTFKNFMYDHGRRRVRFIFKIIDRHTLEPMQLSVYSKNDYPSTFDTVEMKARWGGDGLYHFVPAKNLPEPKNMYCKNRRFMWDKGSNYRKYKRERAAYKKERRKAKKLQQTITAKPLCFTKGEHTYYFDDEHGDINTLIDINGYYFIGDKSERTKWDGRFMMIFEDGSFSIIRWKNSTFSLPLDTIGVPGIDLTANLPVYNPDWTGLISQTEYPELTGGTYVIKGDTIITEYVASVVELGRKYLFTRSFKVVDRHTLDPIHWTKRSEDRIIYDVDCSTFKNRYGDGLYHFVPAVNLPSSVDMTNKRKKYMWKDHNKWKNYLKERKEYMKQYKRRQLDSSKDN